MLTIAAKAGFVILMGYSLTSINFSSVQVQKNKRAIIVLGVHRTLIVKFLN